MVMLDVSRMSRLFESGSECSSGRERRVYGLLGSKWVEQWRTEGVGGGLVECRDGAAYLGPIVL